MDILRIVYWVSIIVLWALIILNFWCIFRSHRTYKHWKKMIKELERITGEHETMRDKYIELLAEQWKENNDETDAH